MTICFIFLCVLYEDFHCFNATYPLTIIHFGNVSVHAILSYSLPQRHGLETMDWIAMDWRRWIGSLAEWIGDNLNKLDGLS